MAGDVQFDPRQWSEALRVAQEEVDVLLRDPAVVRVVALEIDNEEQVAQIDFKDDPRLITDHGNQRTVESQLGRR